MVQPTRFNRKLVRFKTADVLAFVEGRSETCGGKAG
jgi:hypothetical protein